MYISGYILKKSQNLGNWEQRYVIVNKNGVFSFKNITDNKPSFVIKSG